MLTNAVVALLAFHGGARAPLASRVSSVCMRTAEEIAEQFQTPLLDEDLAVVGLATVFITDEDGKPSQVNIVEPLPSGTVETIGRGVETSYRRTMGLRWRDLVEGDVNAPTGINMASLDPLVEGEVLMANGEDWLERARAATRTIKRRREECEKINPFGKVCAEFNFSTSKKRIIDQVYEPGENDNIKQDLSIDVYGRSADEDYEKEVERLASL